MMPPSQYIEEAKDLYKFLDYSEEEIENRLKTIRVDKLDKLFDSQAGNLFLPYLDYKVNDQDGLHRALYAWNKNIEEIPVLVIEEWSFTMNEQANERTLVRDWYLANFPEDAEEGSRILKDVTFDDVFEALDTYEDIYETLFGDPMIGDSIVRERVFTELADMAGYDYGVIYDQWLMGAEVREEREDFSQQVEMDDYERRVQELEAQGISRSDAQAIVDAEDMQNESISLTVENKANKAYNFILQTGSQALNSIPQEKRAFVKQETKRLFAQIYETDELMPALDIINRTGEGELKGIIVDRLEMVVAASVLEFISIVRNQEGFTVEKAIEALDGNKKNIAFVAESANERFMDMVKHLNDEGWASSLLYDVSGIDESIVYEEKILEVLSETSTISEGAINFTYSKDPLPTYALLVDDMDEDEEVTMQLYMEAEELIEEANNQIYDFTYETAVERLEDEYGESTVIEDFISLGPIVLAPGYYESFTLILKFDDFTLDGSIPKNVENRYKYEIKQFAMKKMAEVAQELGLKKVRSGGWAGPIVDENY